ncbi:MAG: hypothetical protein Q7S28_01835 [bacterium]|nr:hypothetical protein [bacterium]
MLLIVLCILAVVGFLLISKVLFWWSVLGIVLWFIHFHLTEDERINKAFKKDIERFDRELADGNPNPRLPMKITSNGAREIDAVSFMKTQKYKQQAKRMHSIFVLSKWGALEIGEFCPEANREKLDECIKQGLVVIEDGAYAVLTDKGEALAKDQGF